MDELIKGLESLSLKTSQSPQSPQSPDIIRACICLYKENQILKQQNQILKQQNQCLKSKRSIYDPKIPKWVD